MEMCAAEKDLVQKSGKQFSNLENETYKSDANHHKSTLNIDKLYRNSNQMAATYMRLIWAKQFMQKPEKERNISDWSNYRGEKKKQQTSETSSLLFIETIIKSEWRKIN